MRSLKFFDQTRIIKKASKKQRPQLGLGKTKQTTSYNFYEF